MELGERIAVLREERALTQAELAERAKISASTLSQIESGRVPRPHVGTVRKIARALSVEPMALRRAEGPAVAGKAEASTPWPSSSEEKEELEREFARKVENLSLAKLEELDDKLSRERAEARRAFDVARVRYKEGEIGAEEMIRHFRHNDLLASNTLTVVGRLQALRRAQQEQASANAS